jgi:hypothetical protein
MATHGAGFVLAPTARQSRQCQQLPNNSAPRDILIDLDGGGADGGGQEAV